MGCNTWTIYDRIGVDIKWIPLENHQRVGDENSDMQSRLYDGAGGDMLNPTFRQSIGISNSQNATISESEIWKTCG